VAVMPYTIDDAATWVRITEIGVDGVITNKPGAHLGFRQGTVIEVPEPAATSVEVRVEQATGQADPTREQPIGFEVVFSEEIVGFDTDDVAVAGSAGAGELTITAITPGRRYLVEVAGATASGDVTVTVPAGAVATAGALTNDASTSTDNTVTVDLTAECDVDYHVFGSWWTGYGVGIVLTNTSDEAWDGWELGWTLDGDDEVRVGWGGSFEQDGHDVTVTNARWNRVVRPDSSVYLGFNARHDGGVPEVPAAFTLGGLVCAG
jgi:Cellulose binding domain